jgi:hypothetical protein
LFDTETNAVLFWPPALDSERCDHLQGVCCGAIPSRRGKLFDVEHRKVVLVLDESGLVSALPQRPGSTVSSVETAAEPVFDPMHPTPERNRGGSDDEMGVIRHQLHAMTVHP